MWKMEGFQNELSKNGKRIAFSTKKTPESTSYWTSPPFFCRKDWITLGLAKSSVIKQALYSDWALDKTAKKWNAYIEYKRVYDKLLNKTRHDYFDKKFKDSQHDLKKTWQLINGILGRKRSNRLLTFPDSDAAHNFNTYFVNIANNLIKRTYSNISSEENDSF